MPLSASKRQLRATRFKPDASRWTRMETIPDVPNRYQAMTLERFCATLARASLGPTIPLTSTLDRH